MVCYFFVNHLISEARKKKTHTQGRLASETLHLVYEIMDGEPFTLLVDTRYPCERSQLLCTLYVHRAKEDWFCLCTGDIIHLRLQQGALQLVACRLFSHSSRSFISNIGTPGEWGGRLAALHEFSSYVFWLSCNAQYSSNLTQDLRNRHSPAMNSEGSRQLPDFCVPMILKFLNVSMVSRASASSKPSWSRSLLI